MDHIGEVVLRAAHFCDVPFCYREDAIAHKRRDARTARKRRERWQNSAVVPDDETGQDESIYSPAEPHGRMYVPAPSELTRRWHRRPFWRFVTVDEWPVRSIVDADLNIPRARNLDASIMVS